MSREPIEVTSIYLFLECGEAVALHAGFVPFSVAMQMDVVSQHAVRSETVQKKTVADSTPLKAYFRDNPTDGASIDVA